MRMFVGVTDGEWFRQLAARLKRNSVPGTLFRRGLGKDQVREGSF
jgi:hypothetical protein